MARRGDQIDAAQKDAKQAKNRVQEDQSRGKRPADRYIEARGDALTKAADLKEAARIAGEKGYRK